MNLIRFKKPILAVQKLFLRFEPHFRKMEGEYEPVFIVGAPRTGSTLLFQILLQQYNFGYISNFMALFPMLLSKLAFLSKNKLLNYDSIKKSDYGVIRGLHAPNEAGKINDLWFGSELSEGNKESIRTSFHKISRLAGGPMLIKSMGNALRVENVLKVFPKARFIFIKRELLFSAQSILFAREALNGNREEWWSLKPQGYEQIASTENPYFQVVWQIRETEKKLKDDLEANHAQYIEIDYRQLCEQTAEVLNDLKDEFGLAAKPPGNDISDLQYNEKIKLDDGEWKQLNAAVDRVLS